MRTLVVAFSFFSLTILALVSERFGSWVNQVRLYGFEAEFSISGSLLVVAAVASILCAFAAEICRRRWRSAGTFWAAGLVSSQQIATLSLIALLILFLAPNVTLR